MSAADPDPDLPPVPIPTPAELDEAQHREYHDDAGRELAEWNRPSRGWLIFGLPVFLAGLAIVVFQPGFLGLGLMLLAIGGAMLARCRRVRGS